MGNRPGVVYAVRGDRELHVDVYEPAGPVNHRAAVLVHHGGGFVTGDRTMVRSRCEALAGHGFTALAVEYRLLGEAPWPAQLHDVKAAIRWTRAHADELGIDPDRVVLQGHSAGAHLAMLAAGTYGRPELDADYETEPPAGPVAAVISYYGTPRLDPQGAVPDMSAGPAAFLAMRSADGSMPAGMLFGPGVTAEAALTASPETYAGNMPPTILFQGTADSVLAPAAGLSLYDTLSAVGVPCELHLVAGADHEFDVTPSLTEVCVPVVASFLQRHVIDPQAFAEEELKTNPFAAMRAGIHPAPPSGASG